PRFFVSFYAGVLAERFERIRLMVVTDLVRAVLMGGLAVAAALQAAPAVLIAVSSVIAVVSSVYDPATSAMVPQLLGEDNLAAGNALTETINNVAVLAGPGIGALVLLVGSPAAVFGLDALTFVLSAVLVHAIRARSTPTDVSADGGPLRQVMVGVRAIVGSVSASVLVSFTVLTTALYGVDSVLFVVLSKDQLGTGAEGYGYLLAGLGVGGVIASAFVNRLAGLPRLSMVLVAGMVVYAAPTALLVVVHSPGVAFGIEVVRGIATLVVDVLAMTALQRSLPSDLIARVFGVFWALVIGGLGAGAFVTPFLLSGLGLHGTLLVAGLAVPVLVLVLAPTLHRIDRTAAARTAALAPRLRILESLQILAAAPQAVLERLAAAATEETVSAGTTIIREGDVADALYVLVDGQVEVTARVAGESAPRHIRVMTAPVYFGEIGLIQQVPRTATNTAVTDCTVLRIDGETFLAALASSSPSQALLQGIAGRLATTQPAGQPSDAIRAR
ncbi:MAG: hypothetical protein QOI42_949, partial [Frankiaceae bacterium]|nr:hypothetical protein [Frankiaceae bacterium]